MTKSELIEKLADQQEHLHGKIIEKLVKELLDQMVVTLANGERIEVRGFGSISLHYRSARIGRNPKTGEKVNLGAKCVPHFKPGRELKVRVNNSR